MKKNDVFCENDLYSLLSRAGRPLHLDDVLRIGRYSRKLKRDVLNALQKLGAAGYALRLKGGRWAFSENLKRCVGRLATQRNGAAYVSSEVGQDIYVAPEHICGAWNGDIVEVLLFPGDSHGKKEGKVCRIVKRSCMSLAVRVMHKSREGCFLCHPCDPRMAFDLLVNAEDLPRVPLPMELLEVVPQEARQGKDDRPLWLARARSFLGRESDAATQERLTKITYGVPTVFPDNVVAEAEKASANAALAGLEDLRGELLVTIDGEDARDFDDAICVCASGKGWRLIVAIADVSHYVLPGSALDKEARERGNSFYFPLSVEPMLPEALCNDACSLQPGKERRCMAVDMQLDHAGNILSARFSNAVMASKARLTYLQVQAIFNDPECDSAKNLEAAAPGVPGMLRESKALAGALIARRDSRGGLNLDLPEAEFGVEDDGTERKVTEIRNRERLFSHRMIEAFMVRANECVAEYLSRRGVPMLYRTHPDPDPAKLEALARALRTACPGMDLPVLNDRLPSRVWLQEILQKTGGDNGFVIASLVLRSLMQARYTTEKDGHFGLASACYCHFTSPIRRYADLANHRALKYALGMDEYGISLRELQACADHCNRQERAAVSAEREISRRMACLFLRPRMGEVFDGVISGVSSFGFFVQFGGMPAEGMVKIEALPKDWYAFEEGVLLRGLSSGRVFRLGQHVAVKLLNISVERLEIDMEYEDNDVLQRAGDFSKSKKKEKKRGEAQKACGHRSAFARRLKDQGKREEKRRERREEGGNDFAFAGRRAEKVMRSSHGYRVDEERNGRHEGEDGGRRRPQRGFSHQNRRQAEDRAFRADRRDDDSDWKSRIYGRKKGEDDVARHEGAPSPRGNRHEDRWRQSYGWEGKKEHFHSAKEDRHFDQERGEKQERRDRKSFGHRQERGFHAGKGAEPGKEGRSWPGEKDRSRNGGKSGRFAKRSPRKGFARDAQENARTGGMPEEFFRIETVGEEKPAFRFGKRRK